MNSLKELESRLSLLHSLSNTLYSQDGCSCGGPLHIILDDCNIRDSDIEFCRDRIKDDEYTPIRELCVSILDMLATLSPAQRLYWWEHMPVEDVLAVANKNVISTDEGYVVEQ